MRHDWLFPGDFKTASAVQRELAERVRVEDHLPEVISRIGGVDVSNNLYDPQSLIYAAIVTLEMTIPKNSALPAQRPIVLDTASLCAKASMPYRPGFLGFREAPPLLQVFANLKQKPDILLVDGHGISHPRRLGIASHIGVLLDMPSIGVAKSILVGAVEPGALGDEPGAQAPLFWKGEQIGVALRSKRRCNPLYISPGHRVSMETAVQVVEDCLFGYRLPEPTRQAHLAANACRKQGACVSIN